MGLGIKGEGSESLLLAPTHNLTLFNIFPKRKEADGLVKQQLRDGSFQNA